jgi:hypothetical protein
MSPSAPKSDLRECRQAPFRISPVGISVDVNRSAVLWAWLAPASVMGLGGQASTRRNAPRRTGTGRGRGVQELLRCSQPCCMLKRPTPRGAGRGTGSHGRPNAGVR